MQIWLFFQPGVGGDGVANLLERSKNITPIDGITDYWRIHRIVDGEIKFYAPSIDNIGCFRNNQSFKEKNNKLKEEYVSIINQNGNCIVTSHDVSLRALKSSDRQDIFLKDQIKILLTSACDPWSNIVKATIKNLLPTLPQEHVMSPMLYPEKFDYVLDVDLVKTSWDYINNFCKQVNLALHEDEYLHYRNLLLCNKNYLTKHVGIEEWEFTINGTCITYNLIDTWKSQ